MKVCTHQASNFLPHQKNPIYDSYLIFKLRAITFFTPHILKLYAFLSLSNITRNVASESFLTRWLMFCILHRSLEFPSVYILSTPSLQTLCKSSFFLNLSFSLCSLSGYDSVCPTALITLWQKLHESSTDSFESLEKLVFNLKKPSPFPFFP